MATLDLVPQDLDLRLYVGDDPVLQFTAWTDATKTVRFDFTGFTGWAATIKAPDGTSVAWAVDASSQATGVITLQLDGSQIRSFPARGNKWDARTISADGREISIVRGRVSIMQDVTV